MSGGSIRALAVCVVRRGDEILVFEGYDSVKDQTFYRPLGGGIEFGETGEDAVVRELAEELSTELRDIRYLATLENIFELEGLPGHEFVRVYEASLADPSLDELGEGRYVDRVAGEEVSVRWLWKPLTDFRAGEAPLYPDGLLPLLEAGGGSR